MATILEALQNAEINIGTNGRSPFAMAIGMVQLHNAIALLEKGYATYDDVESLIEGRGSVEAVPEKGESCASATMIRR